MSIVDEDMPEECPRCGSSADWQDCWDCYCEEPEEDCVTCGGHGGWLLCVSSEEWCKAHPLKSNGAET